MGFIDWHYKGLRVRKWHRTLIWRVLSVVFLSAFMSSFVYYSWKNSYFALLAEVPWDKIIWLSLFSITVGLFVVGIVFFAFLPLFRRFLLLQRICTMIFSSDFYKVNDFESPNMLKNDARNLKRTLLYFPTFYVKMKKEKIQITVRLDGSKFHQSEQIKELSSIFEESLGIDLVGVLQRKRFLIYEFEKDNLENRLTIDEVIPNGYVIQLMKNIRWDIAKIPHGLIVGGTGSGKTFFLFVLIRAFALMGADIRIGDPKNSDLADTGRLFPHVYIEAADIREMVHVAVIEMNQRYAELKKRPDYRSGKDFTYYGLKPLVLVIDEYVAWLSSFPAKKDRDMIMNDLRQVVLKGRQVGVLGFFATQRPDAQFLMGDIRDQLGLRVALGEMSSDGYRMTFGQTEQAFQSKPIKGHGYLNLSGDFMVRELYSPLVPKNYDFIKELADLLGNASGEFTALPFNSLEAIDQFEEPLGDDYVKRETIYEEVSHYERSE
uniref:FtsK/SpoIIIE domain-containing protein n=1 Tax=Enterococcus faecalis TaxID=1351 RepID=UPI00359C3931